MPELKSLDGILLVDKPTGLTSNGVLQRIKHLYKAKKAGHTGCLDPLATGMLPICFGEATKFSQYLLDANKCYQTTGLLGIKTNSGDATGEITQRMTDFSISLNTLNLVLETFTGSIQQIPSMFSALKHQGKPLYRYARAGIEIERKPRSIDIESLILDRFDGESFDLTIVCSKGTYIRNLVEDIGDALGVGAHITRLHRVYTAGFEEEKMYSFDFLMDSSEDARISYLLPVDRAIDDLPTTVLKKVEVQDLFFGKSLMRAEPVGAVRLYDEDHRFLGLGNIDAEGFLKSQRLISTA